MIVNSDDADVVAAVKRVHNSCALVANKLCLKISDLRAGEGKRKRIRKRRTA